MATARKNQSRRFAAAATGGQLHISSSSYTCATCKLRIWGDVMTLVRCCSYPGAAALLCFIWVEQLLLDMLVSVPYKPWEALCSDYNVQLHKARTTATSTFTPIRIRMALQPFRGCRVLPAAGCRARHLSQQPHCPARLKSILLKLLAGQPAHTVCDAVLHLACCYCCLVHCCRVLRWISQPAAALPC
jgi:hypothetical protein